MVAALLVLVDGCRYLNEFSAAGMEMADTNIKLLSNLLDALDRLYDNDTTVTDLHALVFATEVALTGTAHTAILSEAGQGLQKLLRSRKSRSEQRDVALNLTDDLRLYLARVVPFP